MTREEMIKALNSGEDLYLGTCRGCSHDLVVSDQDQSDGPENEILLECGNLDGNECVTGEWFLISELTG